MRSMSPCSTATVARASSSARWHGGVGEWKKRDRVSSLQLRTSSRPIARRAMRAVSTTRCPGHGRSALSHAPRRKDMS